MSQASDLKALTRRAYLAYHQDGIIDLMIGWMAFSFGVCLALKAPFITLLAWLPLLTYIPIKNALTVPRMGVVHLQEEFGQSGRKRLDAILAVLLSVLILAIAGLVLAVPNEMAALGEEGILIYAAMVTLLLLIAGLLSDIKRLIVYGLLCILLAIACALASLPESLMFIALGLVIMFVGVILLARFLHKYPPVQNKLKHGSA
jgi:hypothetical protein